MFSTKQKVYTTESKPINAAEDVGVEGKRYPTHGYGRALVKHPVLMFLTFIVPLAFFITGCVYLDGSLDYSLSSFRLRPTLELQRSTDYLNQESDAWAEYISGEKTFAMNILHSHERSYIQDTFEVRYLLNVTAISLLQPHYGNALSTNLLDYPSILTFIEAFLRDTEYYTDLCFTNDYQNGLFNFVFPTCVPISSVAQYMYPTYVTNSTAKTVTWNMSGEGETLQQNFLPRMMLNKNYAWFLDSNFSTSFQVTRAMRSQITFASSGEKVDKTYRKKRMKYLTTIVKNISRYQHPFLSFYVGGDVVEGAKAEKEVQRDGYKVGVAAVIIFGISWWHCATFVMGFYTVLQVMVNYGAACGLYGAIFKELPLMTFPGVIWVTTFGMHGTLSFYDMFVFTGVMATKGRTNNLSVAQRLCFTLRRITVGVWIANILAIIIFSINTTSIFYSVYEFSIFMMIAFLWNMYCIALCTPAAVMIHHFYFSGKRRNLQKQRDLINAETLECRRGEATVRLLEAVQDNLATGEALYTIDEDVMRARIGANRGVNKRRYKGFGNFISRQVQEGIDKLRAARQDIVGAANKVRKTKRLVVGDDGVQAEMPAFQLDDFMDVGPGMANPLHDEEGGEAEENGHPVYTNARMVPARELVHINPLYTLRSEAAWEGMHEAMGQPLHEDDDLQPPHVFSLQTISDRHKEVAGFAASWDRTAERLGVEVSAHGCTCALRPLIARSVVRGQDPSYIVGCRTKRRPQTTQRIDAADQENGVATTTTDDGEGVGDCPPAAAAGSRVVRPGTSGFGLRKLRDRWLHRKEDKRNWCCGMLGRVENETAAHRMERLMNRKVKQDGYTLFERFLIRIYVPILFLLRWLLLLLLVALFVVTCIFGSFIKAGSLPVTLVSNDGGVAKSFAALDSQFERSGTCTYCGPYYSSPYDYDTATAGYTDLLTCATQGLPNQMNYVVDQCGVCNGSNACVDCSGVAHGTKALTGCGGCEEPTATTCTCDDTHECSYCYWGMTGYTETAGYGAGCSVACNAQTDCHGQGTCNAYSGVCECDGKLTVSSGCTWCTSLYLPPSTVNGVCGLECTSASAACPSCVDNKCQCARVTSVGAQCAYTKTCGDHGTLNTVTGNCDCATGWVGDACDEAAACGGRGTLLTASESPTGEAMCACHGHWRGVDCQLCDCLNGGMCSETSHQCVCPGTFTGPRCATCNASCVLSGTCPTTPSVDIWNVRTCIPEFCTAAEAASYTVCASCGTVENATCAALTDSTSCMAVSDCFWLSTSSTCVGAVVRAATASDVNCVCNNNLVYGGAGCQTCLAPNGASCTSSQTIRGCDGVTVSDYSLATATDLCGTCGGSGTCLGCDGSTDTSIVYDVCGVCGGDGNCANESGATAIIMEYVLGMRSLDVAASLTQEFAALVLSYCTALRQANSQSTSRCLIESYLADRGFTAISSINDLYAYASSKNRLSEIGFQVDDSMQMTGMAFMKYNVPNLWTTAYTDRNQYYVYEWTMSNYVTPLQTEFARAGFDVNISLTSDAVVQAAGRYLANQSLWFSVGIGMGLVAGFLFVYFVSVTTALGGTLVAGSVCFGTLTVCYIFNWEVDAVLQVCISCTIPIAVEYVIHIITGYYDYLQTTTSHLFAKEVGRRTALQGAMLRSFPALCTSVVTVIVCSIMFDVSNLVPSQRSGQISITMHLIVAIAVFFFSGALGAIGPMSSYKHWTLSTAICLLCGVGIAVSIAIIYGVGGVYTPDGKLLLGGKRSNRLE